MTLIGYTDTEFPRVACTSEQSVRQPLVNIPTKSEASNETVDTGLYRLAMA